METAAPRAIDIDCGSPVFPRPRKRRACSVDTPTPPWLRASSSQTPPRRGRSVDRSPPILRLTQENLHSVERSTQSPSPMAVSRSTSPMRRDTTGADMRQLFGYNITVDADIALPEVLARFVATLKQSRERAPSPHAQAIKDARRAAMWEDEITAQDMLGGHILFWGEHHPGGIKGLTLKRQVNLVKDYLPTPPCTTSELFGSLPQPQPDSCIGYITTREAKRYDPELTIPFTRKEDEIATWFNVVEDSNTHFPFLTAQWKSAISGESQVQASLQAARDGALIVNYMHYLYSQAYPDRDPTQLETCHFSLTTEGYTIMLWIHWREVCPKDNEVYFRMEAVEMAHMRRLEELVNVRRTLHNYLDFAFGERLASIKRALPAFWSNCPKLSKSTASTSTSS